MPLNPRVIMNRFTIGIKGVLMTPAVFKTVQMNLDSLFLKSRKFIKNITGTPVIGRIGNIKGNDM